MRVETIEAVDDKVREIVLGGALEEGSAYPHKELWAHVRGCGSTLWLDTCDIERSEPIWCREFSAFTTNNSLLNTEVAKGEYDDLIAQAKNRLRGEVADKDMALEITFVLNAYHALRLVQRFGAMVSVELHTDLADDVDCSVAYGRRYYAIAPDHFYVKVPFTAAGLLAARRLTDEGIPVNCTLGFSARQNYLIAAAARPAFVNVFLGRLNSFVSKNKLGSGENVGERAAIASQQAVARLRSEHGIDTRQIAASMRDGNQVLALAGIDVLTMPIKVAEQFEELSPPAGSIASRIDELPEVDDVPGAEGQAARLGSLWDVPPEFRQAVHDLMAEDAERLSPERVRAVFAERGFPGFLPDWSPSDRQAASKQGKIPDFTYWRGRLASGAVGLDALMSLCALQHFAADQATLDARTA